MAGYLIVDVGPIHDEEVYAAYRSRVPGCIAEAGGRNLARGGAVEILERDWSPKRVVVVRSDSVGAARRWWSSKEYFVLKPMRQASTTTRMVMVEGIPDGEAP